MRFELCEPSEEQAILPEDETLAPEAGGREERLSARIEEDAAISPRLARATEAATELAARQWGATQSTIHRLGAVAAAAEAAAVPALDLPAVVPDIFRAEAFRGTRHTSGAKA